MVKLGDNTRQTSVMLCYYHHYSLTLALLLGSLSDAVGHVTMDDKHEEHRQKLRVMQTAHGTDHIMAGLKGFGLGLYGGLTSIVSQSYTGATQEGLPVSVT